MGRRRTLLCLDRTGRENAFMFLLFNKNFWNGSHIKMSIALASCVDQRLSSPIVSSVHTSQRFSCRRGHYLTCISSGIKTILPIIVMF